MSANLLTRREIEAAIALKATGLLWSEVGERLGRDGASLRTQAYRFRKGAMTFKVVDRRDEAREIERLIVEERVTETVDLAPRFGMTVARMSYRLHCLGFDREVRASYRDEVRS